MHMISVKSFPGKVSHLCLLSFSFALAGKGKPSKTTNGVTPAFFTERRYSWNKPANLQNKKYNIMLGFVQKKQQLNDLSTKHCIEIDETSHLCRVPHSDIDTYKALCIQHEASMAAV